MQKSYCYTPGVSVGMQNVRANVKYLEFKSFCIFSCILTLLIILIKPLSIKAYDRCASGDCGTSGSMLSCAFFSVRIVFTIIIVHWACDFSIFCMVDQDETCLPVSVYNLAQGSGVKIGDSVAIPEPYLQHVKVDFQQHVCIMYKCIGV